MGALPGSLDIIRKNINGYVYLDLPINKRSITVFCNDSQKTEVKTYLDELSKGKMRTKLGSYFDQRIRPTKGEIEWQVKHPLSTNFWWDIENHLMFWEKNNEFETKFKQIIAIKPQK